MKKLLFYIPVICIILSACIVSCAQQMQTAAHAEQHTHEPTSQEVWASIIDSDGDQADYQLSRQDLKSKKTWDTLLTQETQLISIIDGDLQFMLTPEGVRKILKEPIDLLNTSPATAPPDTTGLGKEPLRVWAVYASSIPNSFGISENEWLNAMERNREYHDSIYINSGLAHLTPSFEWSKIESIPDNEFPSNCNSQNVINSVANVNDGFLDNFMTVKQCGGHHVLVVIPPKNCGETNGIASYKDWQNFTSFNALTARFIVKPEQILGYNETNGNFNDTPGRTFSHEFIHVKGGRHNVVEEDSIAGPVFRQGKWTIMNTTGPSWFITSNTVSNYLGEYWSNSTGTLNHALLVRYMHGMYLEFMPTYRIKLEGEVGDTLQACGPFTLNTDEGATSYTWNGPGVDNVNAPSVDLDLPSGSYTFTLEVTKSCGSMFQDTVTVLVAETVAISETYELCPGETLSLYGSSYTDPGNYQVQLSCDTLVNLTIDELTEPAVQIDAAICEGDSWQGYSDSGVYSDTFTAANGCDSTRTVTLEVLDPRIRNEDTLLVLTGVESWDQIEWYVEGELISKDVTTLIPPKEGAYTVEVERLSTWCTSPPVSVTLTSVDEVNNNTITNWPNPSNGSFFISGIPRDATISLFDGTGRQLPFHLTDNQVTVPNYTGLVIVLVQTENGIATGKVLIH